MSQENVEIIHDGFAAFERGELDRATAMLAEDIYWEGVPGTEPCRTRQEVEETIRSSYAAGPPIVADELIDAGDQVVAVFRVTGELPEHYRGHDRTYTVCTLREGKVSHMHDYLDRA